MGIKLKRIVPFVHVICGEKDPKKTERKRPIEFLVNFMLWWRWVPWDGSS